MTCSVVTRAWGNKSKNEREELASPDGELSHKDDFTSPAFPFISPPFSLLTGSAQLVLSLRLTGLKMRPGILYFVGEAC